MFLQTIGFFIDRLRSQALRRWTSKSAGLLLTVGVFILAAPSIGSAGQKAPVRVIDDKFQSGVSLIGPSIDKIVFIGTNRRWNLITTIDRQSGLAMTSLVVSLDYNGDWRWYEGASDDNASSYPVTKVGSSVGMCGGFGGCTLAETISVQMPDAKLAEKRTSGFELKLFARSGDSQIVDVTGEQIDMQLAAIDSYRAAHGIISTPGATLQNAGQGIPRAPAGGPLKFGASFVDLPANLAVMMRRPGLRGVLIVAIQPGSVADHSGLQIGDAVFEIDGRQITSKVDVQAAVATLEPGRKVLVRAMRGTAETALNAEF